MDTERNYVTVTLCIVSALIDKISPYFIKVVILTVAGALRVRLFSPAGHRASQRHADRPVAPIHARTI